jgi:tetrahydromethanopterin S-methyltransferase subunit D
MTRIKSAADIVQRLRANWDGYVREYRVFLILAVLAALADAVSTAYFMVEAGPQTEGHPAVRLVSAVFGPIAGPILGKLCQFTVVVALTVYLRRWAAYIFVAVFVLYAWAAWYNVCGCELYYPRFLDWLDRLTW